MESSRSFTPGLSCSGIPEELLELTGPLMSMIVLPYLGRAAANRELERPVPKRQQPPASRARATRCATSVALDLPHRQGARLGRRAPRGPRTVRSGRPRASRPRTDVKAPVAPGALRAHPEHRLGPGTGAPNIWTLTERGEAIHEAIASTGMSAMSGDVPLGRGVSFVCR